VWPLILKYRVVICLAVAGLVVLGAVYNKGRIDGTAAGDRRTLRMYEAAKEVVAKRAVEIGTLRDQSDEDAIRIARLSHNARVRVCTQRPANRLPGDTDASAPGDDRASGEDITGLLRQCLRTFGQVNRATSQGKTP
jgi:hypothetical protein